MQRLSDFTNSIMHIITSLREYNIAIMSRCQYFLRKTIDKVLAERYYKLAT